MEKNAPDHRILERVSLFAALSGGVIACCAILFSLRFYLSGSLSPDPASGRVYPISMHGTLYVSQMESTIFYVGIVLGVSLVFIGGIIALFLRRSENQ